MATKILPSADDTDQLGQSTANGDASNLRWKGLFSDVRVEGDLTVTGDTTTVSTTNTLIQDKLLELASGTTGDPAATDDKGIIFDRGDDANAAIIWDESAESFLVGTTTSDGDATGAISVTTGTLVANLGSGSTLTEVKVATELNDTNGNELLAVTATASAVNHLGLANSATNNNPTLSCVGGDTNIGMDIALKGDGSLDVLGTSASAAQLKLYEDTDDGTNYIGLKASNIVSSYTLTLPTDAPDTSGLSLVATDAGVCSWSEVSAGGLSDGSVSLVKLDDLSTLTVIGRTSAGDGIPEALALKDEDNMFSDSAVSLVTQQSVKAYVDSQTVNNADWSGTDLAVSNGGTGASNAAGARTSLGLVIGTDVQAYDAQLTDVAGLAVTDGNFIVGDGTNFVAESGATARTSLGLGSISTQAANSVAVTGGTVTGITDITIADGGTGASDAATARTNLGVAIGSNVQAYDAQLTDVAGLAVTDGNFIVGDGTNFVVESGATARTSLGLGSISTQASDNASITGGSVTGITDITVADGGTGSSTAAGARTNLGLGSISTQAANSVAVTGGTVTGITDITIADGGTGASNAAGARTSLGVAIGSDVQAYDAQLTDVAGLAVTDGNFIVGDGINFVAESGATARTSLGLGSISTQAADAVAVTGGSVTGITDITVADGGTGSSTASGARANLGLGSISTQAANAVAITGGAVTGITDITVADGGTGASNAAGARTNLGVVIGAHVQAYDAQLADVASLAVTNGNFIVGDGTNFVAESGATARTSLGVVIGTDVQAYDAQLTDVAGLAVTDGNFIVGDGTNFVAESGATARTSLGLTIGTHVQAYDAQLADVAGLAVTDGNFIVGDGTNFVAESGATARTSLGLGSISTQAANSVAVTGGTVTGITDITVADGGTGASNAAGARTSLGVVIGTDVQAYDAQLTDVAGLAVTDGNFIIGDGTNFVAESGATARTSLGLGSISTQAADAVAVTGGSVTGITDITVADGGTGASDAATARTNLGVAIGSDVQAYDAQLADIASSLTATAAELNYNDITTLGTTQASKAVTTDASNDISHGGSVTVTGAGNGITINNGDLNVTGNGQVSGSFQVNDKLNLSGSVATLGATTLKIDDSLIELNYLGADASGSRDVGIIARTINAVSDTYQGLVFDGSDSLWKFLNTTTYPGADNYVSAISGSSVSASSFLQGVATTITANASTSSTNMATIIPVNASAGAVTVTLHSSLEVAGRVVTVKDIDGSGGTNNISLDATGTIQIGAAAPSANAVTAISSDYAKISLYCDGTNWFEV